MSNCILGPWTHSQIDSGAHRFERRSLEHLGTRPKLQAQIDISSMAYDYTVSLIYWTPTEQSGFNVIVDRIDRETMFAQANRILEDCGWTLEL
jgi:hypothetical protein